MCILIIFPALGKANLFFYKQIAKLVESRSTAQGNRDHEATDYATIGCMIGFTVMMILDVALG